MRSAPGPPGVFGNSSRQRVLGTRDHHYSIQHNFALADDLDLATARQLPALGPVLAEIVDYSTRCVAPRATILTSHDHGVRGNVVAEGESEKYRNEGNEKNTIAVQPQ